MSVLLYPFDKIINEINKIDLDAMVFYDVTLAREKSERVWRQSTSVCVQNVYLSLRAATPGRTLPSRSSKEAPPPVEM